MFLGVRKHTSNIMVMVLVVCEPLHLDHSSPSRSVLHVEITFHGLACNQRPCSDSLLVFFLIQGHSQQSVPCLFPAFSNPEGLSVSKPPCNGTISTAAVRMLHGAERGAEGLLVS